ncbi:hypothetical protein GH714_035542 [Hevea brasiliensis]|uniref:Uncharacterized protein n=1 Tax=Hevea brasiliensis TaxID=3981 RepID=A0A6A6KF43_HEVBR|nr:hypothetical protein GH714_035542 [Hevea brasiliensis]
MATNTAATRESRRRKILERGGDRLALITGRTQTLPSESDDKPHPDSSQQFNSHQDSPPDLSDRITGERLPLSLSLSLSLPSVIVNFVFCLLVVVTMRDLFLCPNNDSTIDAGHIGSHIEPPLSTHAAITETSVAPAYGGSNGQSSIVSSTDQKSTLPTSSTQHNKEHHKFRPLYLVLLTSLTLVLARLLFNNQEVLKGLLEENIIPSTSKYDWAEQAGKALEVGLVMQKAIEAVFMDCSVYV